MKFINMDCTGKRVEFDRFGYVTSSRELTSDEYKTNPCGFDHVIRDYENDITTVIDKDFTSEGLAFDDEEDYKYIGCLHYE